MVVVTMSFAVPPLAREAFEGTWRRVFMPAVAAWPGFLDCRLLRPWPIDADGAESSSVRIDLMFVDEQHRIRWATSQAHDDAFTELASLADGCAVTRFLLASGSDPIA